MAPSSNNIRLILSFVIGVLAISTSAIFVKLTNAPSSVIATYRLFFTVVLFLPPTLVYYAKELRDLKKQDLIYSVLAGIFLAFHFITWFESLKHTSVTSSVVLVSLQPIFTMIGGFIFFKEKYPIASIYAALFSFSGSVIISWGDFQLNFEAFYGDILAIIGALMASVYWLFGQRIRKEISVLPYTTIVYGSSTIVLFLYDLLLQFPLLPYNKIDWLIFLLLAIIPTVLGHTLFNWAVKYVKATTVSMAILGEPIGAAFLAYIIFNEPISATQIVGGCIIILGILMYNKSIR